MDKTKKYLFVCAHGQSRSRYFAEKFNLMGAVAQFCGWDAGSDIKFNGWQIIYYDIIVLLDNNMEGRWAFEMLQALTENKPNKRIIKFYIDDIPSRFNEFFKEFLLKLDIIEEKEL